MLGRRLWRVRKHDRRCYQKKGASAREDMLVW